MLNKLFYGHLGFHGGVRASAGMCLGFFAIAIALLRPRLPPTKKSVNAVTMLRNFSKDPPYVYMTIGTAMVYARLYFPIYFIQLNAIKNGIEPNLAFYTLHARLIDCDSQWKQLLGTDISQLALLGLLAPMIASLAKDHTEIGARIGICLAVTGIGGLVGTPIAGALLSTTFVWWRPIIFSGICVSAGAFCFGITHFLIVNQKSHRL
ncbi:hypothetical protein H0H92_013538 [Tricholoma furcatifolium]|nr:hypothetical protein H0H92_013538 [Tricholoma furcatifolium]